MDALVVVDVEDRIRVRLARGFEGDLHEARAEDVREDGGADRAVLVEHLVDDVPGVCADSLISAITKGGGWG